MGCARGVEELATATPGRPPIGRRLLSVGARAPHLHALRVEGVRRESLHLDGDGVDPGQGGHGALKALSHTGHVAGGNGGAAPDKGRSGDSEHTRGLLRAHVAYHEASSRYRSRHTGSHPRNASRTVGGGLLPHGQRGLFHPPVAPTVGIGEHRVYIPVEYCHIKITCIVTGRSGA